tara:strand:- start:1521 stop:2099 length:579 start_codon:yes stop_codon:yes gene_type:complete
MSGSIQGANQGAVQANQNVGNKAALNELKEYISQTANETMNALKDLTEELSGRVTVKDPNKSKKKEDLNQKETIKQGHIEEGAEIAAASLAGQDELERKKRKKKKFEEKLKSLSELISFIDVKQLDEKDKKEIDEFKQNLNQLNSLNKQLELLEKEETFLEEIIEKNQDQKQEEDPNKKDNKNKEEKDEEIS